MYIVIHTTVGIILQKHDSFIHCMESSPNQVYIHIMYTLCMLSIPYKAKVIWYIMPLVILTADEMNGFYSEFEEEILAEDGEVEEYFGYDQPAM